MGPIAALGQAIEIEGDVFGDISQPGQWVLGKADPNNEVLVKGEGGVAILTEKLPESYQLEFDLSAGIIQEEGRDLLRIVMLCIGEGMGEGGPVSGYGDFIIFDGRPWGSSDPFPSQNPDATESDIFHQLPSGHGGKFLMTVDGKRLHIAVNNQVFVDHEYNGTIENIILFGDINKTIPAGGEDLVIKINPGTEPFENSNFEGVFGVPTLKSTGVVLPPVEVIPVIKDKNIFSPIGEVPSRVTSKALYKGIVGLHNELSSVNRNAGYWCPAPGGKIKLHDGTEVACVEGDRDRQFYPHYSAPQGTVVRSTYGRYVPSSVSCHYSLRVSLWSDGQYAKVFLGTHYNQNVNTWVEFARASGTTTIKFYNGANVVHEISNTRSEHKLHIYQPYSSGSIYYGEEYEKVDNLYLSSQGAIAAETNGAYVEMIDRGGMSEKWAAKILSDGYWDSPPLPLSMVSDLRQDTFEKWFNDISEFHSYGNHFPAGVLKFKFGENADELYAVYLPDDKINSSSDRGTILALNPRLGTIKKCTASTTGFRTTTLSPWEDIT